MPIIRVEPSRLYRRIADQIRELILAGEFPPGSRLPPERDLAHQFGVSRPSLREALIALEISGFVTVMTGSGIYVRTDFAGSEPASVPDGGPGPFELIRARHLIESEVAAVAAREATAADVEGLDDAVRQMREEDARHESREDADRLFHLRLAGATQNSALSLVVQGLWDQGRGRMWEKMQGRMHNAGLRPRWIAEHSAVLEAVRAKDPKAARRAMQIHLSAVEEELEDAWNAAAKRDPANVFDGVGKPSPENLIKVKS
ncbi:MAG TPA: FadR/GntR family transcriptional regulator [Aliidongia sp.]|uniref:FadR/GntR family transcriptional regulator n=1 Tax=Aliidongia sp. TaxID=1914230 RepID=UPI002DDCECD4|nr:FadR/GntR family transcriptional regulator [Aliidongia sp.]HEV2673670.1 FadR/GntR family transcriptional regulator [Aliidongia sp.]